MSEHQRNNALAQQPPARQPIPVGQRAAAQPPLQGPPPVPAPPVADPSLIGEPALVAVGPDEWAEALARRRQHKNAYGTTDQKLAYPRREGYHRHWANDLPGRLAEMQDKGYRFVEGKDGKHVSQHMGVTMAGTPLIGYLMEIPEAWYKEDMASVQAKSDVIDEALRRGDVDGKAKDGRYIPERGIKIESR